MPDIAVAYAEAGALVLPLHTPANNAMHCSCNNKRCEHPGKHPRTMHGKDDATSDVETVARWWSMWPIANIGIRPHPGQIVLDVDPRNGGDVQIRAMVERYGPLGTTRSAITGGGGAHIWFLLAGDVRGELCPGVDLKTHAGYVVAPPSLHVSGKHYTWWITGPIADAPEYLGPLVIRRPVSLPSGTGTLTEKGLAGLVGVVAAAPVGKRSDLLNWACYRAAERGGDLNQLVDAAVGNGLTRREAEATARSALRAVQGAT